MRLLAILAYPSPEKRLTFSPLTRANQLLDIENNDSP